MHKTISTIAKEIAASRSLPDDARLNPVAASEFLAAHGRPVKPATLAKWRCGRPDGPGFVKAGKAVSYPVASLRAFVAQAR